MRNSRVVEFVLVAPAEIDLGIAGGHRDKVVHDLLDIGLAAQAIPQGGDRLGVGIDLGADVLDEDVQGEGPPGDRRGRR